MRMVAIKLSDGHYQAIKAVCRKTDRTVSQYIRDILLTSKHPFARQHDNTVNTNEQQAG